MYVTENQPVNVEVVELRVAQVLVQTQTQYVEKCGKLLIATTIHKHDHVGILIKMDVVILELHEFRTGIVDFNFGKTGVILLFILTVGVLFTLIIH